MTRPLKLWIIRHAKSSWAQQHQADFDRDLNNRGRRDGPQMGSWLAAQQQPPTWIWTSSAVRAQATADFVCNGIAAKSLSTRQTSSPAPIQQDTRQLYHADPETVIDVLQQTPSPHESVAVVAHNPGLTQLLNLLVGRPVTQNLPTLGIAELELSLDSGQGWHNLHLPQQTFAAAASSSSGAQANAYYAKLVQLVSPKTLA